LLSFLPLSPLIADKWLDGNGWMVRLIAIDELMIKEVFAGEKAARLFRNMTQ
jgi:hypothetical protein